jgi:Kdo2-lipid IVA lauroyltransferase/acyltransferase
MASATDVLEYAALRTGLAVASCIPLRAAGAIAARVGALGYWPLGVRRSVVESQLTGAFPDWDQRTVRRVARQAYEHLGRTALEAALLPTLSPDRVRSLFDGEGDWPVLVDALARGRGAIVVTGHIGNWELAGAYIAARGVPVTGVVRRMTNPLFDRYLTATRERAGLSVIADDPVRRVPRALRSGHVVALVADQGVKGMASTYVPFFGRLAKTPRGPGVFALRLGVPLVVGTAVRLPSGKYRALVEPVDVIDTGDRERDVDAVVSRYTGVLERWVREYPEQYLWHHRRWKRRPEEEAELEERLARAKEGEAATTRE